MDDTRIDFVESLESDMAFSVMMCMDDPADLVRASTVSRFWRQFVISNGLSKELCVKKFPQLKNITSIRLSDVGSSESRVWNNEEKDHNVYSSLLQILNKSILKTFDCVSKAICASSTDNYPDESIINTLNPRDRYINRASYWSSTGQSNPDVPETLVYKLRANLCLITEIKIQPFEAFFQEGGPIYSPKAVRFKMGHPKSFSEMETNLQSLPWQQPNDDKFVWTYTSQEFPMTQEYRMQEFKLPEPVICIGGFVKVELLGRVQRQEMDGLFYICVSHVQINGRPLSPAFDIESVEQNGKFSLKYYYEAISSTLGSNLNEEGEIDRGLSPDEILWGRVGLLEYLMGGNENVVNVNVNGNGNVNGNNEAVIVDDEGDEWDDEEDNEYGDEMIFM